MSSRRGSRTRRGPLDEGQVVLAALGLLDEVGVEGFTMRALADRLSTFPNTVYWHAGNRDRVLALVVDRALGEMTVPDPSQVPWRDWLALAAREYRRVLHAHPNTAALVATQVLVSPPTLDLVEAVLSVLESGGYSGPALTHAYNAFVGSLVGWVSVELAAAQREPEGWQAEFALTLTELDPERFPTIGAHHEHLHDQAIALRWHGGAERPLDDSFEAALRVWLDGLAAGVAHG
ncbi:MAG TPA: TetR/AcrR family transcriptional regulator C-terminal domain-containing protein [Candidatus Nanopelagicales bacterium]|nr:TetR/AcrR family transcriptional regulator C-terminal domain-containing protein [Candidatus Nanopelagicales bacterium]